MKAKALYFDMDRFPFPLMVVALLLLFSMVVQAVQAQGPALAPTSDGEIIFVLIILLLLLLFHQQRRNNFCAYYYYYCSLICSILICFHIRMQGNRLIKELPTC